MPSALTYPGVYIEEIPSGVRTIVGVGTSIAAFVGRTKRGPTDEPITINNFGDFERVFGGLWVGNSLGYAVRDFFLNGGSQAIVVRLFHPKLSDADRVAAQNAANDTAAATAGANPNVAATAAKAKADTFPNEPEKSAASVVAAAAQVAAAAPGATVASVNAAAIEAATKAVPQTKSRLTAKGLQLEARNEGSWSGKLRARIDLDVQASDATEKAKLFNLSVLDGSTGELEVFRNVSVEAGHVRQVDKVLENGSLLVRMIGSALPSMPVADSDPPAGKTIWDDAACAKVTEVGSDGDYLTLDDFIGTGKASKKEGLYALSKTDLFNILCLPPYLNAADKDIDIGLIAEAAQYCVDRRAMLLVDPPLTWKTKDAAKNAAKADVSAAIGTNSKNAALFFPRLRQADQERDNQIGEFVPCGTVAGIFARTDATRGVWKAPAGFDATIVGTQQLSVPLTDAENGELNSYGINCLRSMPAAGRIVWGSRTLQGDDRLASEWKYIPVRRTALFIEESLYRGTHWVVFEPNDEPLWAQIRLNVGAFMNDLFRQGAFQGQTPREAYFVKCDKETTTQNDIDKGIVNILVGFAPLKPAEFVVIKLQQIAGDIQT